jgi:hypothetical protein
LLCSAKVNNVEKRHAEQEHEDQEHPPPKFAPGPKLPKPAVPHVYIKRGPGFAWEERMPPDR